MGLSYSERILMISFTGSDLCIPENGVFQNCHIVPHPLKGVLATIWRSLRGHTQADLTRRLCKLCNWNFGIFWRMFPLIMESFKNIRELCLAAATDRWKSEKSAFLRVLVKKLQGPEEWFLENQSSTYRWKKDSGRKKLTFNFEILFCSIFIREMMA